MSLTTSLSSPIRSFDPFSKPREIAKSSTRIYAARREARNRRSSGRLVDENLIVLRKRIHEMKAKEENLELPREWMDWERRFYASYDSIICDAMGHLQNYLMETRPSLAIGVFALVALSVPASSAVVIYNLLKFGGGVLSGINLG